MSKEIHWTTRLEEYFAHTGEKASCLAWVHKRAESMYSSRKIWIDLPVAIGAAVTGFISVGSPSMFAGAQGTASTAIGVASLGVSILNTVGSYFNWAKRAEGHRISSIQYAKLYRFIMIEMALPRDERMTPHDFLKYTKEQYDRLAEISPLVPEEIMNEFKAKFSENAKYAEVAKPEEANGLSRIHVFVEDTPGGHDIRIPKTSLVLRSPSPMSPSVSETPAKVSLPKPRRGSSAEEAKGPKITVPV